MAGISNEFMLKMVPSFWARNYQRVLDAETAEEKVKRIGYLYSLIIRTLTITLVSQYVFRDKETVRDKELNDLLLSKFPQLTSDAWLQIFFTSIKAYREKEEYLFMGELYDWYWDESVEPHRYRSEEENALRRLGQIAVEVETDKYAPQDEQDWKSHLEEVEELLVEVVAKLGFIENYELVRVTDIGKQESTIEFYKGLEITSMQVPTPDDLNFERGWFYWRSVQRGDYLPLHPLLIFWEEMADVDQDVAVYERYTFDKLQYLLALLGKMVFDDRVVKDFVSLILETLQEDKRKREQVEKLTWDRLDEICENISQLRMSTVRRKYNPRLYLQRVQAYEAFQRYLVSEKKSFVLVGKSGVGKSNFVLSLMDELRERDDVIVLMYDGGQLKVEPSINQVFADDFSERLEIAGKRVENVWGEVGQIEDIMGKQVVLFVDAINENPQAKELLRQLDELVQSHWGWLKVVFTCRPETWQVIRRGVRLADALYYQEQDGETIGVELEPFVYSEKLDTFETQELEDVYKKYKDEYQLQTDFRELDVRIREVLRDPLNLWLVASSYRGRELPRSLAVSDLVEKYLEALKTNDILEKDDLKFLEGRLVPLLLEVDGKVLNFLTAAEIDVAGGDLYEAIYNEQVLSDGTRRNEAFTHLVDAEILVKAVEGFESRIAFKYERFYEYFVGKEVLVQGGLVDNKIGYYEKLVDCTREYPFLWGAIKNALVYMARKEGREGRKIIIQLSFTERQDIKELLVAVLQEVGQNELERAEEILKELIDAAKVKGRRLPLVLVGKDGYDRKLIATKKIVVEVASALGLVDMFVALAGDRSQKVRAHMVKYAYYLWLRDEKQGYVLLERFGEQVMSRWGLPNTRKLDFIVNMVLMIFLQHFEKDGVKEQLQELLRTVIRRVFYVDARPLGLNLRGLDYWLRELVLRASIGLVTGVASQSPRYFPANMKELNMFFEDGVLTKHKETLSRILDYMGDVKPNIKEFEQDVMEIMKTEDAFSTYFLHPVFIRQVENFGYELLPVIEKLYDWGMQRENSAVVPQSLFILYWSYLYKRSDALVEKKQVELEIKWEAKTKGEHRYRSGQLYGGGCINLGTHAVLENTVNYEELPLSKYLHKAIENNDIQYILDIIWLIEEFPVIYGHVSVALYLCKPILGLNDPEIQDRLIGVLARIRQYYPYAIDGFLLENNCSASFSAKVYAAETSEQENIIFGKAIPFFYFKLPNSPYLRSQAISLYREMLETPSLQGAIIVVLKKLITLLYGEDIFLRR